MEEHGTELRVDTDLEDRIFDKVFDDDISAAMEALPDVYRDVILLADVEGLSYKEVADVVGCPIGTVMSRLSRGRRLLRKRLRNYAEQYGYV
jgi:RNA polymerase sigma-70 factor (ECF subfamily)